MRRFSMITAVAIAFAWSAAASAQGTIERLYALDCGQGHAADQARWSPGVNVGKPIDISDNCYLIRHAQGWLMWDTGVPEGIAAMPDGLSTAGGAIVWRRPTTIASQLAAIGVRPADIRYVGISHTHGDHIGNVDMFPGSTLLIQKAEVDWAFAEGKQAPFKRKRPMQQLNGDHDVFGDGSAVILSTPGHTPGHQSLLVHLAKTGYVVLTGDLAHFKDNWDHDRVPSMNTSADQTHASHAKVAKVLADKKAKLWINHDKPTFDALKKSPQYYE